MPLSSAQETEAISAIVEAMSAEGYKYIKPAYYELALGGRYSKDPDSVEMLDIIFQNRTISFTYLYQNSLGALQRDVIASGVRDGDLASTLASYKDTFDLNIGAIIDFYNS